MSLFAKGCRLAVSAMLAMVSVIYAQESRGTIVGRVIDSHDAGIADARVTITNIDTGIVTTLQTNDSGSYVAPLLLPGNYRVTGEHAGFKK